MTDLELFPCEPMSARITEWQCKKNQKKCAEFLKHGHDYFKDPRNSDGTHTILYKFKNWGPCGKGFFIHPLILGCTECERFKGGGAMI